VHIVEEPLAAAIGIRMPIFDPIGSMIIDIGGGTTDIAVISLGGVVKSKNVRIAGDRLNNDIINYIRNEFKILIGEKTAETIKINIGAVLPGPVPLESAVRGRDLVTGLPREVVITDADVREAIASSIDSLIESSKEVLETIPPEVIADVMRQGVYLTGGGALIKGFDILLAEYLKIPVHVAPDPLTAVARGTGIILEDINLYKELLIQDDNELPPKKQ
jgi:rod shape-determining protein MreB